MAIPENFESLSVEEQRMYFESLPTLDCIAAMDALLTRVEAQLDAWPELIFEGLETRLATDEASRRAADQVLSSLTRH